MGKKNKIVELKVRFVNSCCLLFIIIIIIIIIIIVSVTVKSNYLQTKHLEILKAKKNLKKKLKKKWGQKAAVKLG